MNDPCKVNRIIEIEFFEKQMFLLVQINIFSFQLAKPPNPLRKPERSVMLERSVMVE